jgi:hypothetical protein
MTLSIITGSKIKLAPVKYEMFPKHGFTMAPPLMDSKFKLATVKT